MKLKYYLRGLGIVSGNCCYHGCYAGKQKGNTVRPGDQGKGSRPWYGGAWKFPG